MKCTASGNNDGGAVKAYLTEADKRFLRVPLYGNAYKLWVTWLASYIQRLFEWTRTIRSYTHS